MDGNGEITLEELKEVLCGEEDDEDIKSLIKQVDKNGDGQINFDEFKDMMLTLYRRNSMMCPPISQGVNQCIGANVLMEHKQELVEI